MTQSVVCPGCSVTLVSDDGRLEKEINASVACHNIYHQLSGFTYSLADRDFIHQLIVDTYCAQHYKKGMKPIAITFALVGLYLVCEKHYTGKQVQNIHIALARANLSKRWPVFTMRHEKAAVTVMDVFTSPDKEKQEMIKAWCYTVWAIWKQEKAVIAGLLYKYLDIV